jgi:hypothetical protein
VAHIFLVRDGSASDYRTTHRAHVVPNSVAAQKLSKYEKKYFANPPSINPQKGAASGFEEYRHVVVKIEADEIDEHFPKAGYYYVADLTPIVCREIFGMTEQ